MDEQAQKGIAYLQALLEAAKAKLAQFSLADYRPYPKQALFHRLGATVTERLLRAGNKQGKSYCGAAELATHLTGRYPEWWDGRRFPGPIEAWAACETGEATRDNPQVMLMGPVGKHGTGALPAEDIIDTRPGRGVADLLDTVMVRHVSGGTSMLGFKHYAQAREAWQGVGKHVIWCDEEPPMDLYVEALARLTATRGIIYTTFTPLKGMSDVVERLMAPGNPDIAEVSMGIEEAEHIPEEERARIIARYPEHEREARIHGIPALGSGRVFPIAEASIKCDPFPVPSHYVQWGAMDFGWNHPFGAVKLAWDRDADCIYVTHAYRAKEQTPVVHAAALRPWGAWLPWSWPHDGLQHDKGSGDQLAQLYKGQGLKMHADHATHEAGGYGTEAGVMDMLDRMKTGRLFVFSNLSEWFEEFRLYHRKEGLIVKNRDDLLSATRIGVMMRRLGRSPEGLWRAPIQADGHYNPLEGVRPREEDQQAFVRPYADYDPNGGRGGRWGTTKEEVDYDVFR